MNGTDWQVSHSLPKEPGDWLEQVMYSAATSVLSSFHLLTSKMLLFPADCEPTTTTYLEMHSQYEELLDGTGTSAFHLETDLWNTDQRLDTVKREDP